MIYPTLRAVVIAALGAPIALVVGLLASDYWLAAPAWLALLATVVLLDAAAAAWNGRGLTVRLTAPHTIGAGAFADAGLDLAFVGNPGRRVELAIDADDRLRVTPDRFRALVEDRMVRAEVRLTPRRRGQADLRDLWVRWSGPLGLVWAQRRRRLNHQAALTPDIAGVKAEAMRLFARDAMFGVKAQIDTGEGTEYHALKDFHPGMDRRTVDWKQSARHVRLLSKEYRTERNHHILLALDTGRTMCEPLAGLPRIDRAINAALTLAFVSLKLGDRVGLFGFDAEPRLVTGITAGVGSFPLIQRLAASLDYSDAETNYTLGLSQLAGSLERRSLIVVFTEFADPTSAELLIENAARLSRRHLVLFVVMRDEELEAIAQSEPRESTDVSRAVTAAALIREREVVIARLQRTGAHIVDAPVAAVGPKLLNAYLDLKRRDLL
ncbi:MAG: DUF58 domain-containing protein [Caulobacterales bacterium]|nr:DUF58 domain-containing protein [Caulobacterales bacterium]